MPFLDGKGAPASANRAQVACPLPLLVHVLGPPCLLLLLARGHVLGPPCSNQRSRSREHARARGRGRARSPLLVARASARGARGPQLAEDRVELLDDRLLDSEQLRRRCRRLALARARVV